MRHSVVGEVFDHYIGIFFPVGIFIRFSRIHIRSEFNSLFSAQLLKRCESIGKSVLLYLPVARAPSGVDLNHVNAKSGGGLDLFFHKFLIEVCSFSSVAPCV
ncbi:hypothetical protein SDC9_171166 [bioreactor metagenome]|uniref:Uncharacterized protein n=1 Tax=bioreactor metagenome TaxID=1076179 RepID=A0A645GJ77_9ZZZZ